MPHDALPRGLELGAVLAGKYRLEHVLGVGGMGVVVAARHLQLRRRVAVKFVKASLLGSPASTQRLIREARAAAALQGRHVARVYDVDALEDGSPYIVLEYLEGRTLAAALEERGRLEYHVVVDYALQVAEALAEAHAMGIVHRDLKPHNLYLAEGPGRLRTLKVLDFGISKTLDVRAEHVSTGGYALLGSPPYMSPEQLVSPRDVDARSDLWSLGVILYQCLSGELPFQGETLPRLCDAILRDPLPPLDAAVAPPDLAAAVLRCLERSRDRRHASVLELSRELATFGGEAAAASLRMIEALCAPDGDARVDPGVATLTEAGTAQTARHSVIRRRAPLAVSLAALALFVWAGARWSPPRHVGGAPSTASPARAPAASVASSAAPSPSVEETTAGASAVASNVRPARARFRRERLPAPASASAPPEAPPEPSAKPRSPLPTEEESVYGHRE